MKTDFFVQHKGLQVCKNDIVRTIKDSWMEQGRLIKDIKTLQMYYNADESRCYWVINGEEKGCIQV
ncbi:hypothetical protein SAMN02745945_01964 [Peptoclostridium litorale DSM 5388]|uniref:Uncharacterized protein n=1 Tax=Peptoclostridium litorale DSM 5388 TaxID=1121324 RepID=A0A069RGS7_PEPLI|nr:DUF6465 family protein [Peptoclostridium litorale]KDR96234.1 hypothetical protein CLIT_4c00710 [Peptoclostridium litorale DSM 5388]SIO14149.1 hypothetical protein SAMN02745945_01964 [Peptoclostridium litorale DSM 5388]